MLWIQPSLFCSFPGMRAHWKPALCRTWLRIGQSRPYLTMSFYSTSNSKSPSKRSVWSQPWELWQDVHPCVNEHWEDWTCQGRLPLTASSVMAHYSCLALPFLKIAPPSADFLSNRSNFVVSRTWTEATWLILIWLFLFSAGTCCQDQGIHDTILCTSVIEQISVYSHRTMLSKRSFQIQFWLWMWSLVQKAPLYLLIK